MHGQQNILITGASGVIGAALAFEYAKPNVHLILQGRNEPRLAHIAGVCQAKGARVTIGAFDITDTPQLQAWLQDIDRDFPLDLVIANQGINSNHGSNGEGERWVDAERLLAINLTATIAMIHTVVPNMRERRRGQIVLVSSLAAYFGLPMTPAYSASKAALKAYGEALRGWLGPLGIGVTTVMPGYVESPMCDAMPGPKPFLMKAERAAVLIKKGAERNRARVSFPFPLNLGTWCLSLLPPDVSIKILRLLGYRA